MASSAFSPSVPAARDFADINITPLVDVMLVLLIIFMVSAPTLSKALEFTTPGKSPPGPQPTAIELRIDANNEIALERRRAALFALQALMAVEAQRDPRIRPSSRSTPAAMPSSAGTRVLAAAREANLEHIAFVQH